MAREPVLYSGIKAAIDGFQVSITAAADSLRKSFDELREVLHKVGHGFYPGVGGTGWIFSYEARDWQCKECGALYSKNNPAPLTEDDPTIGEWAASMALTITETLDDEFSVVVTQQP